jgi:hypothetical protein
MATDTPAAGRRAAPRDAADRFTPVLGSARGREADAAAGREPRDGPDPGAVAELSERFGERAHAVARLLVLMREMPAPQPVPAWAQEGLNAIDKLGRLHGEDYDNWAAADGSAALSWQHANGIAELAHGPGRLVKAACYFRHAAIWLLVFPDALDPATRSFCELCWRTLEPTLELAA